MCMVTSDTSIVTFIIWFGIFAVFWSEVLLCILFSKIYFNLSKSVVKRIVISLLWWLIFRVKALKFLFALPKFLSVHTVWFSTHAFRILLLKLLHEWLGTCDISIRQRLWKTIGHWVGQHWHKTVVTEIKYQHSRKLKRKNYVKIR